MTQNEQSIKTLADVCPGYQDMMQFCIDSLSAANCMIEAEKRHTPDPTKALLQRLQEINVSVIKKIRGEE